MASKKRLLFADLEVSLGIHIPGSGLGALRPSHPCGSREDVLPSGERFISDISHTVSIFHTQAQRCLETRQM